MTNTVTVHFTNDRSSKEFTQSYCDHSSDVLRVWQESDKTSYFSLRNVDYWTVEKVSK